MLKHILLGAVALAGLPAVADAATIYSNNFETNANGIVGGDLISAANGSTSFIGNLTTGRLASLTLNTTGYLTPLTLSFDVYAILSLDGDGPAGGNGTGAAGDRFTVNVNGTTILTDLSYANFPGNTQSAGGVGSAPQTGAAAVGSLGYSFSGIAAGQADAVYHYSFSVTPTGAATTINFIGNSNQGTGDEFFGFDNVLVTGNLATAVPEPATWGMMLAGFGLVGAAARRRRGTVAVA